MSWFSDHSPEDMVGKVLQSYQVTDDTLTLCFTDGSEGHFYHRQDCCENVYIQELDSFEWAIGKKLTSFSENIDQEYQESYDSATETKHVFDFEGWLIKVKWLGESNGYYSESVDFNLT